MSQPTLASQDASREQASFARSTTIAIAIRVAGLGLSYLVQVSLARWLGKTEFGIYEYVVSWALLLQVPAELGLPAAVLRFVPEYRVRQEWGRWRGIVRGGWWVTAGMGVALSTAIALAVSWATRVHPFAYADALAVGIWLVPLFAIAEFQLEAARAGNSILLAFVPIQILWPLSLLAIGGGVWLQTRSPLESTTMLAISSLSLSAIVLVQGVGVWQRLERETEAAEPVYAYREWLAVALPLLLQGAFQILLRQTDIVMVGSLVGPEAAGFYSVAVKVSTSVSFFLQTANMVAAPTYATLYAKGDRDQLQAFISTVGVWIFYPTLAGALVLISFAGPILSLFGADFVAASGELRWLAIGEIVSSLCGSVGYLMAVTGQQNRSVVVFGCAALANVVGNAIAVPLLGSIGAAIVTAMTLAMWNLWLSVLVVKHIGVRAFVFARFFPQKTSSS